MEGLAIGVFGADRQAKEELEGSVAKKSETEGIIVYSKREGETRISFMDDTGFLIRSRDMLA